MKPENCIFTPNHNVSNKSNTETESHDEFYTILGDHDFLDSLNRPRTNTDNKNTLAKRIKRNNSVKFYIKTGAYGRIYNPMGMFSEGKNDKFIAKIGKKEYDFQQVSQKIFDMYISFLSTKNIAWLNNAEREMI